MKKFLFTLASLVAFGFAANAQPVIALNTTEVTMGQENNTLECYFVLQDFGGATQIKGMDYKLEMHNVAGEIITAPVHLEFLEKYGSAEEWKWFGDVSDPAQQGNNITATNGLPGGYAANVTLADDFGPLMPIMDGVETGSEVVYTGKYNFINVNTGRGYLWNGRFGTNKNIIGFTIKVEEGWNEPYAELVVTQANVSASTGEFAMELQTLKIINADYEEPQTQLPCAQPVINQTLGDNEVTVTITWNESDGNKVYTGQYTYTRPEYGQPDESYNVEAYTEESANYLESPHATATINVPAKDPVWQAVDAPVINQSVGDDVVTVTITWPTTTGDKVYTGEYTYTRPEAGEPNESYQVEAYTTESYPYQESTHATATINVPAKEPVVLEDLTGELVFSAVDQTNGTFTVTYEGPEEDVVVTIVGYQERGANGQLPEQGKYYIVTAKASKGGYNDLTDNDELIWLYKPVIDVNVETVQQWIGPEDNAVLTTGQIVTIESILNDNPDGVIMYSIDGGIAKVWTGEAVEVTGNGDHVIEAWVVANGDVESEHATETIHIDNDFTAVNEIANGKAVAGVRYFNLAGQEMTEANGVTIVVTTYTDGTTSAVKVMK